MRTWLTETFNLAVPVVIAPMAGVAGGRLAAAVSAAGALGMIGVGAQSSPDWVAEQCEIAAAGGAPFGGGHGHNDVATLPLLQSVLERLTVPVLAAGGIGTACGLAAVLAAGAAGASVGTAFLTCLAGTTSRVQRANPRRGQPHR